jgi:hypothetical protein
MKRIISLICLVAMMLTMLVFLTSCAKVTCSTCGEEKSKMSSEVVASLGDKKIYMCKDCRKAAEEAKDNIQDGMDKVFGD